MSTLTGDGYLLLNLLESFEKSQARSMAAALGSDVTGAWNTAINLLNEDLASIGPNTPFVKAALGARFNPGTGFVTLVFNNSTNSQQVDPALPVSVALLQVSDELYSGALEVISPDDALSEALSLRYGADLEGSGQAEFQWRWVEPSGGLLPNTDFATWLTYGPDSAVGTNEVSLSGDSPIFIMSDHYFAVRYRPADHTGPSGDTWSDWTYSLAPGWVKRAMNGVNPFEQVFHDRVSNAVDTRVTMISQAGRGARTKGTSR